MNKEAVSKTRTIYLSQDGTPPNWISGLALIVKDCEKVKNTKNKPKTA